MVLNHDNYDQLEISKLMINKLQSKIFILIIDIPKTQKIKNYISFKGLNHVDLHFKTIENLI